MSDSEEDSPRGLRRVFSHISLKKKSSGSQSPEAQKKTPSLTRTASASDVSDAEGGQPRKLSLGRLSKALREFVGRSEEAAGTVAAEEQRLDPTDKDQAGVQSESG
jgi:hypothetical protein